VAQSSAERQQYSMEIRDAVVIVTGASSGLGEAAARLFTSQGAKVALAARSQPTLQRIAADLPGSLGVPVDLRDAAAIARMVAAVHKRYGRIDILINNAGQGMHGFMEHVDVAQYRLLMDLNLYAPLLTMQAVIPYMRQQGGGVILNISAPLAQMPVLPGLGAYAASKAALTIMTLTARAELAADHIHVGLLYPGMMATQMNAHLLPASTTQSVPAAWVAGGDLPPGAPQREAPEDVGRSVLEAIKGEDAEYYTEGFRRLAAWVRGVSSADEGEDATSGERRR
jgi:NAD(P)-dependent dehydrogenase (short-subunit alcohol dehydrogenase family)